MRAITWLVRLLIGAVVFYAVRMAVYLLFLKVACGHVASDWSSVRDLESFARQIAITDVECIGGYLQTRIEWLRLLVPMGSALLAAVGTIVVMARMNWPTIKARSSKHEQGSAKPPGPG